MSSISLAEYRSKYAKTKPRGGKKRTKKVESKGEETLALHLKALNIKYEREFKFCESRKWKADFHILESKLLVEVEGGIWSGGRHTRGSGYIKDLEKYNEVSKLGYTLLRFSTEQVVSGKAIKEIQEFIGNR